jgi:2-desacetyl-2-hydroxyethyl bacteriochlorophyllide A dehydrogenase
MSAETVDRSDLSIPETMQAAVLMGPGRFEMVEKPVPRPGFGQVLVRVAMCGTCGTDVTIQRKPFPGQPPYGEFTPGHEWAGVVVDRAPDVDEVEIGDRVAIHVHHGCGRCSNCLVGSFTACLNYGNRAKGHRASGFTVDGGFAEYVVHAAEAVHRIPESLSWEDAVLVTTAGTAMYGIERAGGLIAGDTVVVVGPGSVGLMAAQVAVALGAAQVVVVGRRDERLETALSMGAHHVVNSTTTDAVERIRELTGGRGADMVIETSGDPSTPNQCLRMLRRGGTLLFLAFYSEQVSFDIGMANREEINLATSRGEGRRSVERVLELAVAGRISGGQLVTHKFPLSKISEGFETLESKVGDPVKLVFVP